MWLINVSFLQLLWRGRYCHPGHYICVFMAWKPKASLLTATRKLENIFPPPFPSLWLHFHLPDGGCALTFAGINLLVYLDFPSLKCLKWNKRPLLWPNLSQTGIVIIGYPRETELTQSKTPPTAITDSIILSKGTYSINDIDLILSSINSSKRSLKFKDYGNVTVFEECLYSTFLIFNYSWTVGNSNHRPLSCYF